jgi:hypothetical protein
MQIIFSYGSHNWNNQFSTVLLILDALCWKEEDRTDVKKEKIILVVASGLDRTAIILRYVSMSVG